MKTITCQCGKANPMGTILCASCGRPLTDEARKSQVIDMRYEGAARRSQTYKHSIIDRIWNFFSSVKVGVGIIVAVLLTSSIGTIFPQKLFIPVVGEENIQAYYENHYGWIGSLYYFFGFHDMYNSWWFMSLIGMLGVSILIASVDRVFPLYKSLKNQRVKRHISFLKRQRIFGITPIEKELSILEQAKQQLEKQKYHVKVEDGALLAEKGRFSRWGPYVNHTGLLIFLIGVALRGIPGFYVDENLWLRDGETQAIPGVPGYYLESEGFILETYSEEDGDQYAQAIEREGMIVKNYQTDVRLYKDENDGVLGEGGLQFIKSDAIIVNEPLTFENYSIFQMTYRLNELSTMTFELLEKDTGKSFGTFTIDLRAPDARYELQNGAIVELKDYFPDYGGIQDGEPVSKSPVPNNPAFIFKMIPPNKPEGEMSFVAIQQTLEIEENDYQLKFTEADIHHVSGLVIRKDLTLPILLIGGFIFMIGVVQGSYWNHRRIWLQFTNDQELAIAAHTNKNWFGLKKDLAKLQAHVQLPSFIDRLELEKPKKKRGDKDDVCDSE